MRIAVVTGICVEHDAISAISAWQAEALAELPEVSEVTIVTQHLARRVATPVTVVANSWDFVRAHAVTSADVVIYHWGVYNELFNSLVLFRHDHRPVVHFHNLTPPHLVGAAGRELQEAGERQIQLAARVDAVWWADSEFNGATLRAMGLAAGPVPVVSAPVTAPAGFTVRRRGHGPVRLLTVGRLVPAKGVDVLVEAVDIAVRAHRADVELTLVGNSTFSASEFEQRLRSRIDELGLSGRVDVRTGVTDAELWDAYADAEILVSPSLHEGLCVPVIEAYLAGCRVIGTDAGNLPFIVQPPDPIVPAGDAPALGRAIADIAGEVRSGRVVARPDVEHLLAGYTDAACRANLATELRALSVRVA